MGRFVPYERISYAIFDLAHALGLGESGTNLVLLSDSALYILQNLAHVDIHREERWASELKPQGYVPIDSTDPDYQAWHDLVERVEQELLTVAEIDAHMFGWTGGAWVESPRPFAPQYIFRPAYSNLNLTGGAETLEIAAVATDKRAVLTNLVLAYSGTNPGFLQLKVSDGSSEFLFHAVANPFTAIYYNWSGQLVLNAGDLVLAVLLNSTAGDDFYAWAMGYQFDE